jgi:hypothetical protein
MTHRLTRRQALQAGATASVLAGGGLFVLNACGSSGGLDCSDTSGLTVAQVQARSAVQYMESSPHADKKCDNCRFWQAARQANTCGGCQIVAGPIHPAGYCNSWVAPET